MCAKPNTRKESARDMAQWLKALVVLPEDPSSGLSTHIQKFKTPVTPVAVNLRLSFDLCRYLHTFGVYTHEHTYTPESTLKWKIEISMA